MLKDPVEIICSTLDAVIGRPQDIAANIRANGSVNFNLKAEIPY